jgi:hypothetical protein
LGTLEVEILVVRKEMLLVVVMASTELTTLMLLMVLLTEVVEAEVAGVVDNLEKQAVQE